MPQAQLLLSISSVHSLQRCAYQPRSLQPLSIFSGQPQFQCGRRLVRQLGEIDVGRFQQKHALQQSPLQPLICGAQILQQLQPQCGNALRQLQKQHVMQLILPQRVTCGGLPRLVEQRHNLIILGVPGVVGIVIRHILPWIRL